VGIMLIAMHVLSSFSHSFLFQQLYPTRTEVPVLPCSNLLYRLLWRCVHVLIIQGTGKQAMESALRSLTQTMHANGGRPLTEPFRSMSLAFINSINQVSAFFNAFTRFLSMAIEFITPSCASVQRDSITYADMDGQDLDSEPTNSACPVASPDKNSFYTTDSSACTLRYLRFFNHSYRSAHCVI
jgi:hypothetical protein